MKRKTQILSLLTAGTLLMCCTLSFTGCGRVQEEPEKTVTIQEIGLYDSGKEGADYGFSGSILPVETVKASFQIAGAIAEIYVKEGETVTAGQPLASLETGDYELAELAARAQYDSSQMKIKSQIPVALAQAEAQLELTQATYDRVKALYDQGAAAKAQFDEIAAKLKVDQNTYKQALEASGIANTELGQAEAALELASSNLKKTTIVSPVDGVVLQKIASVGEVTGAGYPVAVIGKIDQVWAQAGVSDEQVGALKAGQSAQVYIYGLDQSFSAAVDEVGYVADSQTRTYSVKFLIENPHRVLKPGMIAKVSMEAGRRSEICIPFSSVVHLADKEVVFLYDEAAQTAVQREVVTGDLLDDRIEVLSGISIGEKLIVQGQYRIEDGEKVCLSD